MSENGWRLCSTCRKPLPFAEGYWVCSVSTCNRKKMPYTFCSVECWDAHVPMMRHRDAWAEERTAPSREEHRRLLAAEAAEGEAAESAGSAARERRIVGVGSSAHEATRLPELAEGDLPRDVLIVASKLKQYIRARSGMNTSESVMEALSDIVRGACDAAIRRAGQDGRKTVMDRDFDA
jgi:hypothetical protein